MERATSSNPDSMSEYSDVPLAPDASPPFLPLEETAAGSPGNTDTPKQRIDVKRIISYVFLSCIVFMFWDAHKAPEDRLVPPDFADKFLSWVQGHPFQGILAILVVMAVCVVFMVPIGTPLTLGCGYIYKGAYGWKLGLTVATIVSMGGSALGAVSCFLLGRYLMRDQVRQWVRNYPLFDAIDEGRWAGIGTFSSFDVSNHVLIFE